MADTDQPTLVVTQADAARLFLAGFVTDDHAANKLRDGVHRMISTRLAIRAMVAFADARTTHEPRHEPRPAGELREAAERLLLAMTARALRGREHVPSMRDEQDAASALRAALATHSPAPMAGEVFRDLEREPLAALHRLQHAGTPAAKPKLGGSILQWAADEIAALRAAHPSMQEGDDA